MARPRTPVEPVDTLTIEFEGRPEKVVTRQSPVSLRDYFGFSDTRSAAKWTDRASLEAVYSAFAPFLISWDFPYPPTASGMADMDVTLMVGITDAWLREVRNVDPPLPRRSSAGDTSGEP